MRKVLVTLVAIGTLALAGVLLAAPRSANNAQQASVTSGLDIFGIMQRAGSLPEQSYPTHWLSVFSV